MIKNFDKLLQMAKQRPKMKLTVAAAQDYEVLKAVEEARKLGFIDGILVGDREKSRKFLLKH